MHYFRVITGQGGELRFPDGTSAHLIAFAKRLIKEINLVCEGLSLDGIAAIAGFADREIQACARFHAKRYEQWLQNGTDVDGRALSDEDIAIYKQCSTLEGFLLQDHIEWDFAEWLIGIEQYVGGSPDWSTIDAVLPNKNAKCVLYSYALLCIERALSAQKIGEASAALGYVAAAGNVEAVAIELDSFDAGINYERMKDSSLRKMGAEKRHAETYALRAEVIEYWKANINISLSTEKAASILSGVFPLSHRTLSQYISSEKKILFASKA